jgi:hypothetical protein
VANPSYKVVEPYTRPNASDAVFFTQANFIRSQGPTLVIGRPSGEETHIPCCSKPGWRLCSIRITTTYSPREEGVTTYLGVYRGDQLILDLGTQDVSDAMCNLRWRMSSAMNIRIRW